MSTRPHVTPQAKAHHNQSILLVVNTGLLLACLNYAITIEHRLTALETSERVRGHKPDKMSLRAHANPCIVEPVRRVPQPSPLRLVSLHRHATIPPVACRFFIPVNRATIAPIELRRT